MVSHFLIKLIILAIIIMPIHLLISSTAIQLSVISNKPTNKAPTWK